MPYCYSRDRRPPTVVVDSGANGAGAAPSVAEVGDVPELALHPVDHAVLVAGGPHDTGVAHHPDPSVTAPENLAAVA